MDGASTAVFGIKAIGLGHHFEGARWAHSRYDGGSFFEGYWQNENDRFDTTTVGIVTAIAEIATAATTTAVRPFHLPR